MYSLALIIFVVSEKKAFEAKLYMNFHWMVLYKLHVFCSDMKFKMAATAELSLTLDPMRKMFQNASSLKPLGLSYQNKKRKVCRGPSNEHSCTVWL
jgi:hypothetical protein